MYQVCLLCFVEEVMQHIEEDTNVMSCSAELYNLRMFKTLLKRLSRTIISL